MIMYYIKLLKCFFFIFKSFSVPEYIRLRGQKIIVNIYNCNNIIVL